MSLSDGIAWERDFGSNKPNHEIINSEFINPRKWFSEKYNIDDLDEKLNLIQYSGNDVIRFINQYML